MIPPEKPAPLSRSLALLSGLLAQVREVFSQNSQPQWLVDQLASAVREQYTRGQPKSNAFLSQAIRPPREDRTVYSVFLIM